MNLAPNQSSQPEITCHWRRSGIFIVNFEHISHLAVVFLLLTLGKCRLGVLLTILIPFMVHFNEVLKNNSHEIGPPLRIGK